MGAFVSWVRRFVRELRRRRVIRVAVVYAGTAFVILQLGEILVEPFNLPDWTLRLVTFLLILGFPLAAGLAWVYNITEEGLVRDVGDKSAREIGPGGRPLPSTWVLIGLLALVGTFLLYPRVFSSGEGASGEVSAADTSEIDERSIAVLPFEPLSSGEESETFARGVHDDLLTGLANISDLKVISRTAVQKYRDADLTTDEIANSLDVRWVMEGGVLESGGQIKVNAQLIDPESDAHVWADDYRRKLTAENLFAIQEDITGEIAGALKAELTAGEQKRITESPTQNLKAYRLYAKGRSRLDTRLPENVAKAADYFRRAVREDSSYALAWSGLADAVAIFPLYLPDSTDAPDVAPRKAARRALMLDPDLAEAHASLGYLQGVATGIRSLRRAVELKPSYAQARHWLGLKLLHAG